MIFHFKFSFVGVFVFLFGFFIGVLALYYNPPSNINIRPDIKKNSVLITHGIYKYIRHPMYLSVILMTFSFFLFYPSFVEFVLWILVIVDLLVKLNYEEKLWKKNPEYKKYMQKTYRLIPFLY
jgi:protein-S-isoprenylcysteine O-methyltransferase Ste14